MDVGCGTGKLLRRYVRKIRLSDLEEGKARMRMLGIDLNEDALIAAIAKRKILMDRHPLLWTEKRDDDTWFELSDPNLIMDLIQMDLIDLDELDLSRTCIGERRVDAILASDVFRYIIKTNELRNEVLELLRAIRQKLKSTGYFVSMEFSSFSLPIGEYLQEDLKTEFSRYGRQTTMLLGWLYALAEEAGLGRIDYSKKDLHDTEDDKFPSLVSLVFCPRMPRDDLIVIASGDDKKADLGIGAAIGGDLVREGYDVHLSSRIPGNLTKAGKKYIVVIDAADVSYDYVISTDLSSVPIFNKELYSQLFSMQEELDKSGTELILAGVKPESIKSKNLTDEARERGSRLLREITTRWVPYLKG
jgi:SAM-dependent methyltransferase